MAWGSAPFEGRSQGPRVSQAHCLLVNLNLRARIKAWREEKTSGLNGQSSVSMETSKQSSPGALGSGKPGSLPICVAGHMLMGGRHHRGGRHHHSGHPGGQRLRQALALQQRHTPHPRGLPAGTREVDFRSQHT